MRKSEREPAVPKRTRRIQRHKASIRPSSFPSQALSIRSARQSNLRQPQQREARKPPPEARDCTPTADRSHLGFPDQRPCFSEWQAWQSVIKFSRQSWPNWLRAFKWWTSKFVIEPHCWHCHPFRSSTWSRKIRYAS